MDELPGQCRHGIDDDELPLAPAQLVLAAAPNPFNPRTRLSFELSATAPAHLALYDLRGRLVRTLVQAALPAGSHAVTWDGRDKQGRAAAAGVYLARLTAAGRTVTTRLALVR